MLALNLLKKGHKVIVVTHSHPPDRVGIRWLLPGLKVYYIPFKTIASSATLPNYFAFLPYFRTIMLREHINIVHGHAGLSSLAQEAILHSHHLGIRTVFTDHSLFGFADAASILTNKLLEVALKNVDGVICVSYTSRENTVLRAVIPPDLVHVIPNAIIAEQFQPRETPLATDIIVISRLAYRKGVDLLVATAPRICERFPNVRFLIGGDGPKLIELLQMRENYRLQDRITLLGSVKAADVRNVLIQGSIFLNTSLTEAFGIAILEAACAGLYVVSTRVGGVPEVLPKDMISFARPEEDGKNRLGFLKELNELIHNHVDVIRAVAEAISIVSKGKHDPLAAHEHIKGFYNWSQVADRTEVVYKSILESEPIDLWTRMQRTLTVGPAAGPIYLGVLIVDCIFFMILEYFMPREDIDYVVKEWDLERFRQVLRNQD
ncbi:hypothetical protein Clacol_004890 [Clathrus columnatus]|uniref:PIGA GPI anchor biosynthesis domain-containing protein n=1 Tax=Clathrus columnatus TaxID=1419009 RepID=A0AAV5ADD8_9AGAM|nr:hypothetical protein Clacol_004890 [Clathrus columnatus]